MWPDNRVRDLFGIQSPIIPAPMAGSVLSEMVVAVSGAGGLGSLPSALLTVEQARSELEIIRRQTSRPIKVNFFCHQPPRVDPTREMIWRQRRDAYFVELGLDNNTVIPSANRAPFDDKMCDLVMEFHPEVVSFHFGLPNENLLTRVRKVGAKIISFATSMKSAGLRIRDATQLSRRAMRSVGIGASSLRRMFPRKSGRWHWCRRSLTR